jgi:flavin reductase (DIM6/NTAB) family NADH-FMN oxidoreductase RutF
VPVSSAWKGERNIMTMGWHMVMEFTPSAYSWFSGRSIDLRAKLREVVTLELAR